jgi:hypothetical protein
MIDDELQKIRKIRHRISAECEHDVHKVIAYYRAIQDELKESGAYCFEESSRMLESHQDKQQRENITCR